MLVRHLMAAAAAFACIAGPAAIAQTGGEELAACPVCLARTILGEIQPTPAGDKQAVIDAIDRATRGAEIAVVTEAVCQLRDRRDIADIAGADPAAQSSARLTLGRPEVSEALGETCEIATLAMNSSLATGGIGTTPARGGVGRAFGLGTAAGSPGGGGGSGYVNN